MRSTACKRVTMLAAWILPLAGAAWLPVAVQAHPGKGHGSRRAVNASPRMAHTSRQKARSSGGEQSQNGRSHSASGGPAKSAELWATVDICRSKPKPTIGVRGSMPADGHPHDAMYMRFQIQYLNRTTKQWTDVQKGGSSSFLAVGAADATRQEGRTFTLAAIPAGAAPYEMRGIVEYQWRRRGHVALSQTRTTTAGHRNATGAIPPHFSASTCTVS